MHSYTFQQHIIPSSCVYIFSPWNLKDVVFVHDKRDGKAEDRFPDLKVINQYIERQWTPNDEKKPIKVKCGPLYCKFVIKVYSNKQQ